MKSIFNKKNIVLIIVVLFLLPGIVTAESLKYKKLSSSYENTFSGIDIEPNESLKNYIDISGNQPPETPDIDGPTIGKPGTKLNYVIVSTDPEENDLIYCFSWGDDSGEVCIGPFPSGEEVPISHTWEENGTYTITVKATDILGAESGLATLKVKISMSRVKIYYNAIIFEKLEIFKKLINDFLEYI